MNPGQPENQQLALAEAVAALHEAAGAEKCWACGCLRNLLESLQTAFPSGRLPQGFEDAARAAARHLLPAKYDCLGCEVCYPALVLNALNRMGGEQFLNLEVCATAKVEERQGWPPLPGAYMVLRYHAPVAICTLIHDELATALARVAGPELSIIGTLKTENLGIERLVQNVVANPHVRFVVLCGADSQQTVGHWPGQSLVALARWGVDDRGRIREARGKRPVLRNLAPEAIEHFRETVKVVDLIANANVFEILDEAGRCAAPHLGPAKPFSASPRVTPESGYLPERMVSDPAGYFVVYVDHPRGLLSLEHYRNDGLLDAVLEGNTAAELYIPVIDKGLISRLDHAAYLGRELARAEQALRTGESYTQDAAPEYRGVTVTETRCACDPICQQAAL